MVTDPIPCYQSLSPSPPLATNPLLKPPSPTFKTPNILIINFSSCPGKPLISHSPPPVKLTFHCSLKAVPLFWDACCPPAPGCFWWLSPADWGRCWHPRWGCSRGSQTYTVGCVLDIWRLEGGFKPNQRGTKGKRNRCNSLQECYTGHVLNEQHLLLTTEVTSSNPAWTWCGKVVACFIISASITSTILKKLYTHLNVFQLNNLYEIYSNNKTDFV